MASCLCMAIMRFDSDLTNIEYWARARAWLRAVLRLNQYLNRPILYLTCRHHIFDLPATYHLLNILLLFSSSLMWQCLRSLRKSSLTSTPLALPVVWCWQQRQINWDLLEYSYQEKHKRRFARSPLSCQGHEVYCPWGMSQGPIHGFCS